MKLSDNIKKLRTEKGVSQKIMASYLNVTPQAVNRWESGRTTPDIAMLPTLASYFGVSIDALLGYDPSEKERVRVIGVLSAEFQYKSPQDRLAACRAAPAQFPTDPIITMMTATALFVCAATSSDGEQEAYCEQTIRLCRRLLDAPESGYIADIVRINGRMLLAQTYRLRAQYVEAQEVAAALPFMFQAREVNLFGLLEGDELRQHIEFTLVQLHQPLTLIAASTHTPFSPGRIKNNMSGDELERLLRALKADMSRALDHLRMAVGCLPYLKDTPWMMRAFNTMSDLISVAPVEFDAPDDRLTPAAFLWEQLESDAFKSLTGMAEFQHLREEVRQLSVGE